MLQLPTMETLGLYPLTVVLSFLTETEGVSLLVTKKKYASQVLPIFRLPRAELLVPKRQRRRHQFWVAPVQDPTLLLGRLNTRRLQKRRRPPLPGLTTAELALLEWGNRDLCDPPELELLRFLSFDHECEFRNRGPVLLVSYPRSGNTLVRTLLERTTGLVTGSDTRPDRSLSKELAEQHGLTGEGVTHGAFVKTHWPERTGNRAFVGKRAILLVRNPYDAIDSYWNMNTTKTHTRSVVPAVYDQFRDKWEGLVKNDIHIWNKFLDYWLNGCSVPVLIVRFEDLIREPARELTRMMEFALQQDLSAFWLERIRHATASSSTEKLGSYRPRSASNGVESIGKSLKIYSEALLDYMYNSSEGYSENYLHRFGYDIPQQCFPMNFVEGREPAIGGYTDRIANDEIRVNDGYPIRPIDCPFGRLLQTWRHSVTNNDLDPLPTVSDDEPAGIGALVCPHF